MRKNLKQKLAAGVALALSLTLLAGCGSEKAPDNTGKPQQDSSVTTESEPEKDDGAAELTQESILDYPESSADDFSYAVIEGKAYIDGCNSKDDVVVVPAMLDGTPVVGIDDYGMDQLNARGIVFPDTVVTIGNGAFTNCPNLEYIHLGSGLKRIDELAFNSCKSLKQVIFPDGMEEFISYPFVVCSSLEKIVIPASVTYMPMGIGNAPSCPDAVVITPAGSEAEKQAGIDGFPVEHP